MNRDDSLERICEYSCMCSYSNYGNREGCLDKVNCRTYWDYVDAEMCLWTWYQPDYIMVREDVEDDFDG